MLTDEGPCDVDIAANILYSNMSIPIAKAVYKHQVGVFLI
jgi:hypothetical protein